MSEKNNHIGKIKPDSLRNIIHSLSKAPLALGRILTAVEGLEKDFNPPLSTLEQGFAKVIYADTVTYKGVSERFAKNSKNYRDKKKAQSHNDDIQNHNDISHRHSHLPTNLPTNLPNNLSTNLSNKREKRVCFVIPSFEEVKNEFAKIDPSLNAKEQAEKFCDHYSANGWKVGSSSMKDWKAAARNWARRTKNFGTINNNSHNTKQPIGVDYKEEGYDLGDWGE